MPRLTPYAPRCKRPAAARALLANLPIDAPADVFLSRLALERRIRVFVARPKLASQKPEFDPCNGTPRILCRRPRMHNTPACTTHPACARGYRLRPRSIVTTGNGDIEHTNVYK